MAYEQPRKDHNTFATTPVVELDEIQDGQELKFEKKSTEKVEKKRRGKRIDGLSLSKKILIFLVSSALFLGTWQVLAYYAGNSAILAGPIPVLMALSGLLQITPSSGTLGLENAYGALLETLEVVTLGLGLSVAVGIPIGVIMGRWKTAEMVAEPWVSATNSIPVVVLIPGLYFSIGGGFLADVFISFVLSVFTVIMNTHAGVRYMSNALAEVGKTFGASNVQFITKIVLPSTLPDIFAGVRIAVGRALLGAIMAETLLGGNRGLGGLMMTFEEILNTPSMMATVVLIALVGILLLQAPKILENRLFRWKEGERISRELGR